MSASVPYKVRVSVRFETEVDWDAVTAEDACREARECLNSGALSVGDLDLDYSHPWFVVYEAEAKE